MCERLVPLKSNTDFELSLTLCVCSVRVRASSRPRNPFASPLRVHCCFFIVRAISVHLCAYTHTHLKIYIYTHYWVLSLLSLPGWLCNWVLGMQPGTSSLCAGSPHYRSLIGISAAFCFGIVNEACGQCQYLACSSPQLQNKELYVCAHVLSFVVCCVCVCVFCRYVFASFHLEWIERESRESFLWMLLCSIALVSSVTRAITLHCSITWYLGILMFCKQV